MANILYIAQFFSTESEPGGQGQRHFKHANALVEDGQPLSFEAWATAVKRGRTFTTTGPLVMNSTRLS